MGDGEEYFPRGGRKPTVTYFKPSGNFLGAAEKGERKKQKPKKKTEENDGDLSDEITADDDQSYKNCAVRLNYKIIKPGQLILGRVRQVLETKINVSLPCKLLGTVMACHISESYNKQLEAYVNDKIDKVQDLKQMFRPGQYVVMRVLEANGHKLLLSMMPEHVHNGRTYSDLHKGSILQAAVSSVEDHGYVMETGIPKTTAFLPKTDTNPDIELESGTLTWCCVKSIDTQSASGVVTLSNEVASLQSAVQKRSIDTLFPATALNFTVEKALDNGIEGHVFEDTNAYIQREQVGKVNGKKPSLGQRVRARVLYVVPPKNTPFLTMKDIFETNLEAEQKFKEGDIIEEAQVIQILGRSIIFKLGRRSTGTLSVRRIQVDEDLSDNEVLAKSYPIGSTHRVRVLMYNMADYTYSVSDETSVLNERYFSLSDLEVGDIVPAIVREVVDEKITLGVGRVTGLVPKTHLTDSGIYVDPKKARKFELTKKKFKVGQEVTARVLTLDRVKCALYLTLKPTLLAPDLEILDRYEQAQVGKAYTGVILNIRNYLLVSFFNGVVAFVPRSMVAKPPPDSLITAFHVGQIVKCTILKVDVERKRLTGSFIIPPFDPSKPKRHLQNDQDTEESHIPKRKRKATRAANDNDFEENSEDNLKDGSDDNEEIHESNMNKKKKLKNHGHEEKESVPIKHKKKRINEVDTVETIDEKMSADSGTESDIQMTKRKQKKKKALIDKTEDSKVASKRKSSKEYINISEEAKNTEESDAIETDIHEDSDQVLTPQDLGLIDLSDCVTAKNYKKRIVSLLKAINARLFRIKRIDKKVATIESNGLDAKNKKYHTAMHMEKLVIEERIKKLMEALKVAQEKFKEFGVEEVKDFKKKKDKKPMQIEVTINEGNEEVKTEKIDEKLPDKRREKVKHSKIESMESLVPVPSAKGFWTETLDLVRAPESEKSSSDEEEETEKPKKKRKKLTAAEKVAKVREAEEEIRKLEKRVADSEVAPASTDEFERALLANPNNSKLWIAYMAFHLQATEIDKARAVGRRALKTISFRNENEKLNMWLALIHLEHKYGTSESQQKTLEEALQMNDQYKVHSKLLDIYVETKSKDFSRLVDFMIRKYKKHVEVYTQCGAGCYKMGMVDKARNVMQKGITSLDKKDHVLMLVQLALLENKYGSSDRAEVMFEKLLSVYPQRVDVCGVYVQMMYKSGQVDQIRQTMERMTSQKLPARKMKSLYEIWLQVEEKIGNPEQIEKVRKRAMEYLEKAKY